MLLPGISHFLPLKASMSSKAMHRLQKRWLTTPLKFLCKSGVGAHIEFRQYRLVNTFIILVFTWQLGLIRVFQHMQSGKKGRRMATKRLGEGLVQWMVWFWEVLQHGTLQSTVFVHVYFLQKSFLILLIWGTCNRIVSPLTLVSPYY